MFPESDHEELVNNLREFFIYHNRRVQQTRIIIIGIAIFVIFVLLMIWILT